MNSKTMAKYSHGENRLWSQERWQHQINGDVMVCCKLVMFAIRTFDWKRTINVQALASLTGRCRACGRASWKCFLRLRQPKPHQSKHNRCQSHGHWLMTDTANSSCNMQLPMVTRDAPLLFDLLFLSPSHPSSTRRSKQIKLSGVTLFITTSTVQ